MNYNNLTIMKNFRKYLVLFYLLVTIFVLSCNRTPVKQFATDTPNSGEISINVDETFHPIIDAELDVFHAFYGDASITPYYRPELDCINALLRDSVRLIFVTRPLSEKELSDFEKAKLFRPKQNKIALDGVALIVNPANQDTLMSMFTLKDILTGKIKKWSEINPKSKLKDIKVVFDNKHSSTVRFVIDSITKGDSLSNQLSSLHYNTDVINFVAENPNTIGVIGVNWVSDHQDSSSLTFLNKVKVLALSREKVADTENSYQPFQAYIALGQYPLTRFLWAIESDDKIGLASGFVSFVNGDKGQRIILKSGILPINQPLRIIQVKEEMPEE